MHSRLLGLISGTAALALAGCSPAAGTFWEPWVETNQVVDEAMAALGGTPILEYEGEIGSLTGLVEPATLELTVTDTGTSYGSAEADGSDVEIMTIDGDLYVLADADFWITQGASESHAKDVAGSWVQVDPAGWFDISAFLTPAEYANLVTQALEESGSLDIALPEPEDYQGTPAYKFPVGEGYVYVTVEPPHTVLAIVDVPVGSPDDPTGLVISTDPSTANESTAEDLLEKLLDAMKKLATIYGDEASLLLSETDADFKCSNSTFSCDLSVTVSAETTGTFQKAEKASVDMKASIDGGKLGTKKCSDKATIKIGKSKTLKCTVSFSVPADGVEYSIEPSWTVTGVAEFEPDVEAITEAVMEELEGLFES